jgi:4-aminobutyrate aminotransferase/(S)-3-amino-2-methylpropionate transaminase
MPIAAVTGRQEIMDSSHPGGLGGTFGGNPVSSAAVVAVFDEVTKRDLLGEARRVGATLLPALQDLQKKHSVIGDVRGLGAMLAIEFTNPQTGKPAPEVAKAVQTYALHQGVLILTAGTFGNVLRFLPPVVITDEQLLDAVSVMNEALTSLS